MRNALLGYFLMAALIVCGVAALVYQSAQSDACEKRGGIYLRGAWGYQCVKLERMP